MYIQTFLYILKWTLISHLIIREVYQCLQGNDQGPVLEGGEHLQVPTFFLHPTQWVKIRLRLNYLLQLRHID